MRPEPDQSCLLCGTLSPCRKTDAGNALFYDCANRDCGPTEIATTARKRLDRTRTVLHLMLAKEAQKARKDGKVLRIRGDAANELHHEAVPPDDVK
jgi:hypothetical protein